MWCKSLSIKKAKMLPVVPETLVESSPRSAAKPDRTGGYDLFGYFAPQTKTLVGTYDVFFCIEATFSQNTANFLLLVAFFAYKCKRYLKRVCSALLP